MSARHTFSILAVTAVIFSGCSGSSDSDSNDGRGSISLPRVNETKSLNIPAGTLIDVKLDQELSTVNNKPGDHVSGTVATSVAVEGKTAIPAGSRVHGSVTAVAESGESKVLKLDFTEVEIADRSYPMEVSMVRAHPEVRSETSSGEAAAQIGAGAIGGAILGRILGGDGKSAAMGAIAGAATGTAIVLGTRDSYAVLPEGSVVQLRTEQPLYVLAAR